MHRRIGSRRPAGTAAGSDVLRGAIAPTFPAAVPTASCPLVDPIQPRRVLVVSARMGAGHTGVARELQRRLEADGHVAEVVDFLDALPGRFGRFMERVYRAHLRYAPWTYDLLYRLRFRFSSALDGLNAFYTFLAGSALCRWVTAFRAIRVVALSSLAA